MKNRLFILISILLIVLVSGCGVLKSVYGDGKIDFNEKVNVRAASGGFIDTIEGIDGADVKTDAIIQEVNQIFRDGSTDRDNVYLINGDYSYSGQSYNYAMQISFDNVDDFSGAYLISYSNNTTGMEITSDQFEIIDKLKDNPS